MVPFTRTSHLTRETCIGNDDLVFCFALAHSLEHLIIIQVAVVANKTAGYAVATEEENHYIIGIRLGKNLAHVVDDIGYGCILICVVRAFSMIVLGKDIGNGDGIVSTDAQIVPCSRIIVYTNTNYVCLSLQY